MNTAKENETENEVRGKIDEFIERLRGFSVQDIHLLINHDHLSPSRLMLSRKSPMKGYEASCEAFRAFEAKEDAIASRSLVEYSSKLREEELNLQMEMAKAKGTLDCSLALAKLKGHRNDPFEDDNDHAD